MTVCIAAMCEWKGKPCIVGAADRRITVEDKTFSYESTRSKVWKLAPMIVSLYAGDDATHTYVFGRTSQVLQDRDITDVNEAAEVYAEQYAELRRRRSERLFLAPYGLDMATFVRGSEEIRPELVPMILEQLRSRKVELDLDAIVIGFDRDGDDHIYVIQDPGILTCEDGVGFAAVGEGAEHAEAAFMLAQYSWNWQADRALALAYTAKKRAELAPTVGRITDMFILFPEAWAFVPNVGKVLDEPYQRYGVQMNLAINAALDEMSSQMKASIEVLRPEGGDGKAEE